MGDDDKIRSISPRPDVQRADHGRAWGSPPKPPPAETWGGSKRRGNSRSPAPDSRDAGKQDASATTPTLSLGKSLTIKTAASELGDKDRAASPGAASTATAASNAPALGRVRGMAHKIEPPMPDPEADLARVLNMVQLPSTGLVLAKVSRESVTDRFMALLNQCLPTERRLPP